MYQSFDSLPSHARLWIYQANRSFSSVEKEQLFNGLKDLCEQWSAHGTPLQTSFTIQFDQFVIMAVDEQVNGASGCSIDGSVRYLKSLQDQLGIDFFDRTCVAFLKEGKIIVHPVAEIRNLFESYALSAETVTFNNTLTTKAEWENHWRVPVKDSWLARYLPKTAVAD